MDAPASDPSRAPARKDEGGGERDDPVHAEQVHLDHARRCLEEMRERTTRAVASLHDSDEPEAQQARLKLQQRLFSLDEKRAALVFGRIDLTDGGERFHVGRRHVEDGAGDPVVIDWRAPMAAPFYRATAANPMELHLRRRLAVDRGEVLDVFDEVFDDPDHPERAVAGGVPDPLLAEIERGRAGEMRDIVATIQAEQDVIIRAPLAEAVIVQGGPGTGKTAVGLHRAAFLLYEHRDELGDTGVLVVGPNRVFLRYIGEVLPSLGETSVRQATVESLVAGARVRATEADDVAALKGDGRMAEVLARLLADLRRPAPDEIEVGLPWGTVRLRGADVDRLATEATERTSTHAVARDVFRRRLHQLLLDRQRERRPDADIDDASFLAAVRAERVVTGLVQGAFPSASPPTLVRRLLGNRAARRRCAAGLLAAEEIELLGRRNAAKAADEPWTLADLPLLDEAAGLIDGPAVTYGHVVVDEAQDLSAMALRMIRRRAPSGSLTILGDLAQATSPGAQHSWDDVATLLDPPLPVRRCELRTGYRLAAPVLDLASRLLPEAAPGIERSTSVRRGGEAPSVVLAGPDERHTTVAGEVAALADRYGLIGVVTPASDVEATLEALRAAGITAGSPRRGALEHQVTVLDPAGAKGLEFDAVLVAEPTTIMAADHGARALYVALTRAVHHLVVVHSDGLPPALVDAA
ncbi:MAG: AAA family ATPase [Actinomycetota bacterium]|nr:AAA family ATPase [Actinomycetota bacterium]